MFSYYTIIVIDACTFIMIKGSHVAADLHKKFRLQVEEQQELSSRSVSDGDLVSKTLLEYVEPKYLVCRVHLFGVLSIL